MFLAAPPSMSDGLCAEQSTRNPSGGSADPAACNGLQAGVEAVDTQQRRRLNRFCWQAEKREVRRQVLNRNVTAAQ
jgi:hypothetical protein